MKSGSRFVAVASAPIGADRFSISRKVLVVGIVARQGEVEGVLSSHVAVNGSDSSSSILKMVLRSRFAEQIKFVVSNGIAMAGLNVIDYRCLFRKSLPLVVVTRSIPRPSKLSYALRSFSAKSGVNVKDRIEIIKSFASNKPIKIGGFYFQSQMDKESLVRIASDAVKALRLAHLVASGVTTSESKGRI
ncbi:MAG: DUF99 family protein [Candidatus Micrarchaeia archaeon]